MIHVGTDLVRIARFERHAQTLGNAFLRRSFTDREVELSAGRTESLAGRWAAKEAVLKALGAGIADIPLTDVEIDQDPSGRPTLSLYREAASRSGEAGITAWAVSISHDGDYAMAVVVGSTG